MHSRCTRHGPRNTTTPLEAHVSRRQLFLHFHNIMTFTYVSMDTCAARLRTSDLAALEVGAVLPAPLGPLYQAASGERRRHRANSQPFPPLLAD